MRKLLGKIFNKHNIGYFVVFGLTVAVLICKNIKAAASFLAPVNEFLIRVIGWIFSLTPISWFGALFVCALPIVILLVALFCLSKKKIRFAVNIVCAACVCLTVFYCVFGFNYSKQSLYETMNIEISEEADEALLKEASEYFLSELNEATKNVEYKDGFSVMPMSFDEMAKQLLADYKTVGIFDFLYDFDLRPKQFAPSFILNYSGITGVFFPIFAEVNVCGNLPDQTLVTTTAHEIGHSKGVNNEGECNFLAEIVCINSENAYIRYAGLANVFARLANELYSVDSDYRQSLMDRLSPLVKAEYSATNKFFKQFEGPVKEVVNNANDAYLKGNDVTEGVLSYSKAVNGLLAFYRYYLAVDNNG